MDILPLRIVGRGDTRIGECRPLHFGRLRLNFCKPNHKKVKNREPKVKDYLTPSEVVERYQGKISVRTLANWRSMGIGPPFSKIGGRILYRWQLLQEWETKRTVNGTSEYRK